MSALEAERAAQGRPARITAKQGELGLNQMLGDPVGFVGHHALERLERAVYVAERGGNHCRAIGHGSMFGDTAARRRPACPPLRRRGPDSEG